MTLNVTQVFDRGAKILSQAIATSGTTVTISRDADDLDATVDFDTLAITDPTPAQQLATGVKAFVTTTGNATVDVGPGRTAAPSTFHVFLPITVTNVADGDVLTVTRTRDTRLAGARLLVTEVLDDAAGVARQLAARRL